MLRLKMALRNLRRNTRRTIISMLMLIGSFMAIVIFLGFSNHMLNSLKNVTINNQYGHIQIAKQKFWDRTPTDKISERYLDNVDELSETLKKKYPIKYISPRMTFYSLLSNGDKTTSGFAWGLDESKEINFMQSLRIKEGENFSGNNEFEILLGTGLKKQLEARIGDTITIVTQTVDGTANAIDPTLRGVFSTGVTEVDDTSYILPLKATKKLMDTEQAERLLIMMNSESDINTTVKKINEDLKSSSIVARSWYDLSNLYRQVEEFYNIQNTVIEFILGVLIILGIANTIAMAIFERMGEIGTMRALGDTKNEVIKQFFFEGLSMGLIGSTLAIPTSWLVSILLNSLNILTNIPGASEPIPIKIQANIMHYLIAFFLISVCTIIATLAPAFRASRVNIVDALRKA